MRTSKPYSITRKVANEVRKRWRRARSAQPVNGANLLRRDINDRSSEVDFGVVLNAGEHEENACKSIWVGESAPLSESRWSKVVWSKAALTQPPTTVIRTPEWRVK